MWSDCKNLLDVKVSQFLKNCSYNCSKKHVNNHKVILMEGSFSSFLRVQKYLYVEIMWVILAIDLAWSKDLKCIWLKCDSSLLCQTFSSFNLIPWSLRGRWRKCVKICKEVEFKVSHIFREENQLVQSCLSCLGSICHLFLSWIWPSPPIVLYLSLFFSNMFHVIAYDCWYLKYQPSWDVKVHNDVWYKFK